MAHSIAGNKHSYGLFISNGHHFAHHFAVRNPGSAQVQCMSLQVHGMCLVAFLFLGGRRWGDVAGALAFSRFFDFEEVGLARLVLLGANDLCVHVNTPTKRFVSFDTDEQTNRPLPFHLQFDGF